MRLFIGIPVDVAVQQALQTLCARLQVTVPARYVSPSLYHITLAYLGERDAAVLPTLMALLDGCAREVSPFSLRVDGMGYFGRPPRAILHATLQPSETLALINDRLRDALRLADEPFDSKPLVPHITLARDAALGSGSTENGKLALPPQDAALYPIFTAQSLTLFHSTRMNGALAYLPLYIAPFHYDGGIS